MVETDAIEAGEKKASLFYQIVRVIMVPAYFYFIALPFFRTVWMPILPTWLTGYEAPLPEFGPEEENAQNEYWLSWGYWVFKQSIGGVFFMTCIMLLIWHNQETILYVPAQPI
jgi:hypothetical protein